MIDRSPPPLSGFRSVVSNTVTLALGYVSLSSSDIECVGWETKRGWAGNKYRVFYGFSKWTEWIGK